MWATSLRMRDQGTRTSLLAARAALRMVVRKSARGSVCMGLSNLPAGLGHARDLATERELAEGDAAQAELAHVGAAAAGELAAVVGARAEFRRCLLFDDPGCLGHRVLALVLRCVWHLAVGERHAEEREKLLGLVVL